MKSVIKYLCLMIFISVMTTTYASHPPNKAEAADTSGVDSKGSCNNYKTRYFCEVCNIKTEVSGPSECQNKNGTTTKHVSKNSLIDNQTFNYIHFATDFEDSSSSQTSGCGSCGGGSPTQTAKGLNPLSLVRFHRFRNITEQSSFGGGIFSNWDVTLSLFKDQNGNSLIDISDPADLNTRRLFPQNGAFRDTFARSYDGMTLYKEDGVTTTTDISLADTAILKTRGGRSFKFEIFTFDEFTKMGRLKEIVDRNDYKHVIDYQIDDYSTVDPSEDPLAKYRMESVTDPNGRTLLFTYLQESGLFVKRKGSFVIETMQVPNGTSVEYNYGPTTDSGLESINYQDGTSSTFTVDQDSGRTRVHFFEAAQKGFDRRKSAYLTNNFLPGNTNDGLQYYNSSALLIDFATKGKVNTETDSDNEEVTYIGMVDGHIMHRKIYEGGGRLKWLDIDVTRFYSDWELSGDPLTGADAYTGTKESKYSHGKFKHYAGNRQGRPPLNYDEQGLKYTYIYNSDASMTRKNYPDNTYEQWAYNEFQQPLRHRDRLGRVKLNSYDSRGNHLMSIVGLQAEAVAAGSERIPGLFYNVYDGRFNTLPNFSSLTPVDFGATVNVEIDATDRESEYAMDFEGDLEINTPGDYIFTSGSDDGSKVYIDDILVVDNDGQHGLVEVDSLPINLDAGYHKIRIEYFAKDGGQKLSTYYNGPDSLDQKLLIPDDALSFMANGLTEIDVTRPESAVIVKQYYPAGDPKQFLIQYEYDAIEFPASGDISDSQSLINYVVANNNKRTEYTYNTDLQLEEIIEPDDTGSAYHTAWTFGYDTAKRLRTSTDAGSVLIDLPATDDERRTLTRYYDDRDRLTTLTYHDGSTQTFKYGIGDDANLLSEQTDRNGNLTKYFYDALGRKETVVTAFGTDIAASTEYEYLDGTNRASAMTYNGDRTEYGYDYRLRRVSESVIADDDSTLTNTQTYIDNKLFCTEDAYGRKTYYSYRSSDSQLIRTVRGTVPSYTLNSYSAVNNATRSSSLNATHIITDLYKDVEGQTFEARDGRDILSTTKYNNRGWVIETVQAAETLPAKTETDFDAMRNVLEVRSPRYFDATDSEGYLQAGTTSTYSRRNKRASITEASYSTLNATATMTYYNDGKPYENSDFKGNMSVQEWHRCCGRLQASIDRAGHAGISNTDFYGNVTHTVFIEDYVNGDNGSVVGQQSVHNPTDAKTLQEVTTRFDERLRPVATTVWLDKLENVDANDVPIGNDAGETKNGLTTSTIYYDEIIGHPELLSLLGKLSISFTGDNGSAQASINPEGEVVLTLFDGAGRSVATGRVDKTTWAVGSAGTLVTWNTVLHDNIVNGQNINGLLETTSTSAEGFKNSARTDGLGRTIETEDADRASGTGNISLAKYDNNSNRISFRDGNSVGLDCKFDDLNRDFECTDTQGDTTQKGFNLIKQAISKTDGKNKTTSIILDARGRKTSETNRNNDTKSYVYNDNNKKIVEWDENQLASANAQIYSVATRYKYDTRDLLIDTALPGHPASSDSNDSYIDLNTSLSSADYDRTSCSNDPLTRTDTCADQQGDTVKYLYDLASRMEHREYREVGQSNTESVDDFTYDKVSRPLTAYKGRYNNTVTYTYDEIGRKKTETTSVAGSDYTVSHKFDDDNRVEQCAYPAGNNVDKTWTERNQLKTLKFAGADVVTEFKYDAGMREESREFSNGLKTAKDYRNDNTLASIKVSNATTQAAVDSISFIYEDLTNANGYDANKNILQEVAGGVMAGYSWDAAFDDIDRVTQWDRNNGDTQTWGLDPIGNWDTRTGSLAGSVINESREHNDVNELESIDGTMITYDAKGNLDVDSFASDHDWDIDNHLTSVSNAGATFTYDALGRRLEKKTSLGNTLFICDGQRVIEEYEDDLQGGGYALARSYVHASYIDDIVAKVEETGSGQETLYYHTDRQYNVRGLTDSSGDIVELYAYSVYGKQTVFDSQGIVLAGSSYNNNYGYTGRYKDVETGLWYFRARYFSDEQGRFINRDPLGYVDGMSLYNGYFAQGFGLDPWGLALFDNIHEENINDLVTGATCGKVKVGLIEQNEQDKKRKLIEWYKDNLDVVINLPQMDGIVMSFIFIPEKDTLCSLCCQKYGWVQHVKKTITSVWEYDNPRGLAVTTFPDEDPFKYEDPSNLKRNKAPNPWYLAPFGKVQNPEPKKHIIDAPTVRFSFLFRTQLVCVETGEVVFEWTWNPTNQGKKGRAL